MDDTTTSTAPDLGAFAGMDFGFGAPAAADDEPGDDGATTQADEESAATDDQDDEGQGEQDGDDAEGEAEASPESKAHNPEGPGNVKAALREVRGENKTLKAQLAELSAWKATQEAERAQQVAEYQQQQRLAFVQQQVEDMDPADVPAYLAQVQQQETARLQADAQERLSWSNLAQGEELLRDVHEDYDTQIDKLTGLFGPAGRSLVAQWARSQPKGALAAYQAAKGLYTQSDIDAAKAAGRQAALDEIAGRSTARKQSAQPRLGAIAPVAKVPDRDPAGRFSKQLSTGNDASSAIGSMFAQVLGG